MKEDKMIIKLVKMGYTLGFHMAFSLLLLSWTVYLTFTHSILFVIPVILSAVYAFRVAVTYREFLKILRDGC